MSPRLSRGEKIFGTFVRKGFFLLYYLLNFYFFLRRRLGITCDYKTCLLYTSDAADEEDSVDLGGRRIIKKKKKEVSGVSER